MNAVIAATLSSVDGVRNRPSGHTRHQAPAAIWPRPRLECAATRAHALAQAVLSKLDLRDRVQAVVLAYETGLAAPELTPRSADA